MSDRKANRSSGDDVGIPDHLVPILAEAADQDLRWAIDGPPGEERRALVQAASRLIDALASGQPSREQVAEAARLAVGYRWPGEWPVTLAEVDALAAILAVQRELVALGERTAEAEAGR